MERGCLTASLFLPHLVACCVLGMQVWGRHCAVPRSCVARRRRRARAGATASTPCFTPS